jgi:hypothetical protein
VFTRRGKLSLYTRVNDNLPEADLIHVLVLDRAREQMVTADDLAPDIENALGIDEDRTSLEACT